MSYEKGRLIRKTIAIRLDTSQSFKDKRLGSTALSHRDLLIYSSLCRVHRYVLARFTDMKIKVEGVDNLSGARIRSLRLNSSRLIAVITRR